MRQYTRTHPSGCASCAHHGFERLGQRYGPGTQWVSVAVPLTLSVASDMSGPFVSNVDLLALDDAIDQSERGKPRQATIVPLRYFGGLSTDETAAVMKLSPATIEREYPLPRLCLLRDLRDDARR